VTTAVQIRLIEGPKSLYGIQCTECHGRPIELRVGLQTSPSGSALVIVLRCESCGRDVEACSVMDGIRA
jgi:hypothetical protein